MRPPMCRPSLEDNKCFRELGELIFEVESMEKREREYIETIRSLVDSCKEARSGSCASITRPIGAPRDCRRLLVLKEAR